jgi:hypothetical protein
MGYVNCVILVGQPFAIKEEKLTVEHLIMLHHKFYKALNMICQWIFGVWEFWLMK